jgi:WhiB family redox-sensing transcriptional regulator
MKKPSKAYLNLQYKIIEHGPVACEDENVRDLFYPSGPDHVQRYDEAAAKELCAPCPVKYECALAAITDDERYGIWGGLTPVERARIKGRF